MAVLVETYFASGVSSKFSPPHLRTRSPPWAPTQSTRTHHQNHPLQSRRRPDEQLKYDLQRVLLQVSIRREQFDTREDVPLASRLAAAAAGPFFAVTFFFGA